MLVLVLVQLEAMVIPLLLTSLVYAGSFVAKLWLTRSSWGVDGDEMGISRAKRIVNRVQAAVADVMVWRNFVVVCSSAPSCHVWEFLYHILSAVTTC
jgi:hypothetical protein